MDGTVAIISRGQLGMGRTTFNPLGRAMDSACQCLCRKRESSPVGLLLSRPLVSRVIALGRVITPDHPAATWASPLRASGAHAITKARPSSSTKQLGA